MENDYVEAVILLPENLFYNTTAPGIILIINKSKIAPSPNRKSQILLINLKICLINARDILGIIPSIKLEKNKCKDIIVIKVEYSSTSVSYHGRFYVRGGSTIQESKGKDLTRFLISKLGKNWDEYVKENASIEDINIETIDKFKRIATKRIPFVKDEHDAVSVLEKLNLISEGNLKRAVILLFGKKPKKFWISAYIKISVYIKNR